MAGKDIIMLKHVRKVKARRDCEGETSGRKSRDEGVGAVARSRLRYGSLRKMGYISVNKYCSSLLLHFDPSEGRKFLQESRHNH